MGWFDRLGDLQKVNSVNSEMPANRNVEDNDYEKQIWIAYMNAVRDYWKETNKWEKLDPGFYKSTLANGDIIFFIAHDNSFRYLKAAEAKFDTEKTWLREFSRRLIYAMDRMGMNQLMLSEKTGISQSSLSNYLNCKKIPSAYTLVTLASALQTTVKFLSVS